MRLVDDSISGELFCITANSERLRARYLLHASHQEKVQHLLIAFVRDSYVEPHQHELPHQWGMLVVMQGQLEACLCEQSGEIQKQFVVGDDTGISVVGFSPGDIHSVKHLSPRALMLEIKEGPFGPLKVKAFSKWLQSDISPFILLSYSIHVRLPPQLLQTAQPRDDHP